MSHVFLARSFGVLVLATLPIAASAQVYKCAQAGGGTTYQSTPCPVAGAKPALHPTAAQLNAERASAAATAKPQVVATADPYSDGHRRRDCTIALQNQSVLRRAGRPYTTDAAGQKTYVMDSDRARLIAEAEHQAAQLCD